MIKKILSTFLVSSVLFVFAATGSYAERPTFNVGVSAAYGGYQASGQENEGSETTQEIHKKDESGAFGYTSLFVEATFAERVTIGGSWMIDSVETDITSRTDASHNGDTGNNAGTSSIKAEFSDLMVGYVEVNIWNGLYAKYGYMEMNMETKESLHTDSSYPDHDLDGSTYGLGWRGSFDNGVFIKTETLMQDWSDFTLQATGATNTDNNNSVNGSLSGAVATISIGKAF